MILLVLSIALFVVVVISWFAIVITGRQPRGLFDFGLDVLRYTLQTNAYLLLMTDTYPPMEAAVGRRPPSRARRCPRPGSDVGARTYLRKRLVVLSASSLPPVWHVGQ